MMAATETELRLARGEKLLTPRLTEYIRKRPTDKQLIALLQNQAMELFYGGSGGGGKSVYHLMAALQYADVPGYSALLIRRKFTDLSLAGALIDLSHEWLAGTRATWDGSLKRWTFPTAGASAVLQFGYLENREDENRYRSSEWHYVGIDELTEFPERQALFLFSRLRRRAGVEIPLRFRGTSNPGGRGHLWVKQRYVDPKTRIKDAIYIPARLEDNPHIDQAAYIKALSHLDPVTRARILQSEWTVSEGGRFFRRSWFEIVNAVPKNLLLVRAWDLAATEPSPGGDPDWTAGALVGKDAAGTIYVLDVRRTRETPLGVERLIRQTAELDGKKTSIWMEQEPGASGVNTIAHYSRKVLGGFLFHGNRTTGSKAERAGPFASQAEAGNVKLLAGRWNADFLDELEVFPDGEHDDQADAAALAYEKLAARSWDPAEDFAKRTPSVKERKDEDEDRAVDPLGGWRLGGNPFQR